VSRATCKDQDGGASALLEISPTAPLFGAWHSIGEGGALGAKFARCLVYDWVRDVVTLATVKARIGGALPPGLTL
jgi:CRISPR-associated protein Csb1